MKLLTAAIYTNYTTRIIDDSGIEQVDAYTAGPKGVYGNGPQGTGLVLAFERVSQ